MGPLQLKFIVVALRAWFEVGLSRDFLRMRQPPEPHRHRQEERVCGSCSVSASTSRSNTLQHGFGTSLRFAQGIEASGKRQRLNLAPCDFGQIVAEISHAEVESITSARGSLVGMASGTLWRKCFCSGR